MCSPLLPHQCLVLMGSGSPVAGRGFEVPELMPDARMTSEGVVGFALPLEKLAAGRVLLPDEALQWSHSSCQMMRFGVAKSSDEGLQWPQLTPVSRKPLSSCSLDCKDGQNVSMSRQTTTCTMTPSENDDQTSRQTTKTTSDYRSEDVQTPTTPEFDDEESENEVTPMVADTQASLSPEAPVRGSPAWKDSAALKEPGTRPDLMLPGIVLTGYPVREGAEDSEKPEPLADGIGEDIEGCKKPSPATSLKSCLKVLTSPANSNRRRSPWKRNAGQVTPQGATSPTKSVASVQSFFSEAWDSPSEALILLDWDDTLCPTTSCARFVLGDCSPNAAEEQALLAHQSAVINFLRVASELGRVAIVTMAEKTWVSKCIAKLMPDVACVMKELEIQIASARESLARRLRRQAFSDDRDPSQYLKTKAMEGVIKQFYKSGSRSSLTSGARPRSWKNIISIGDSSAERLAVQDLVFRRTQRDRHGQWKECRCKTMLLLESPTLEQITNEVCTVTKLMSALVRHDGDIHVDMDPDDLDAASLMDIDAKSAALDY